MAAGYIAGPSPIRLTFYKGYAAMGFNLFRQVVPGVLLLSALAGAAAGKIGPEGKEACRLFRSLSDVFGYAGTLLLRFLPVGLFCFLCPTVVMRGMSALWPGVKLALVTAFCCIAYGVLVYGFQLRHCGKDCPRHFLRNFKPVLLQAFTACSSGSGEGDALRSLQRMGITEDVGLPAWRCGALLGKTGTVLYWGIACLTVMRYAGVPVSFLSCLVVFVWIIFMSLVSTKYRGSGLYCALILVFLLGLPLQAAALPLLLLEWLLDGVRSGLNSAAAGTGAYLADKLGWMK
jgi:Na+/H+-dicarboxylate symporter